MVKNARPRFSGDQQPKIPLWGYVDESNPEVMENKISVASSHGVSSFIYDWYGYDDGPFLQRALEEGFLKIKKWVDIHLAPRTKPYNRFYKGTVSESTATKYMKFIKRNNH